MIKALIHGHVQGVGYRRFVYNHAVKLGIKGYVKNRDDGSVELVAYGDKAKLDQLLKSIDVDIDNGPQVMNIEIVEESEKDNDYDSFVIL
ncbi:MAG: acylphosphatase [Candidatus Micrarchaeota archaeon]|nr:MAG: acylphosphatase [Candidatus Micrarchaeota archaeon]